jgi:CRP-like cAMP-binding protein
MAQINLRTLESLADYSNAELKLLASVAPAREYEQGADLCIEGSPGQSCYVLATGEVTIYKLIDSEERNLATLRAGSLVGQMSLVDRSPRSATVRANKYTIALELNREVFMRLLNAHSPLALRFQSQIAVAGIRQLRMATQKLSQILNEAHRKAEESKGQAQEGVSSVEGQDDKRDQLLTVQAALSEWDMSLDELDEVRVSIPRGQISASEMKSRM